MLWTVTVAMMGLWALGLVGSFTSGEFIHFLLFSLLLATFIHVIQGRLVLRGVEITKLGKKGDLV